VDVRGLKSAAAGSAEDVVNRMMQKRKRVTRTPWCSGALQLKAGQEIAIRVATTLRFLSSE
jgi:hypothetical protein